jgi:hypothetical protein
MLRIILSVVVGFLVWLGMNVGGGYLFAFSWPDYAAADPTMSFTVPMLLARIVLGVLATLAAGWVAAIIARGRNAALVLGIVLVLFFIPVHAVLWDKFPLWYHLFFLLTLLPLCILGGRIASRTRPKDAQTRSPATARADGAEIAGQVRRSQPLTSSSDDP